MSDTLSNQHIKTLNFFSRPPKRWHFLLSVEQKLFHIWCNVTRQNVTSNKKTNSLFSFGHTNLIIRLIVPKPWVIYRTMVVKFIYGTHTHIYNLPYNPCFWYLTFDLYLKYQFCILKRCMDTFCGKYNNILMA